jgi:TPR repeat protein
MLVKFEIPQLFAAAANGALHGVAEAAFELGTFFYFRNRDADDAKQATRWLTAMARKGSVVAQTRLGASYIRLRDFATARDWLLPAARQNNAKALILLGRCYEELDYKTGARLAYNRYAELGYDRGRRELLRLDGLGSKDFGSLLRQVYANDIEAQYRLGTAYLELSRAAKTLPDQEGLRQFGLKWLRTAATQGHEAARSLYNEKAQQLMNEEEQHG